MITAGIDVGIEYTKAVVMKEGVLAGKACGYSGGAGRPAAVRSVYEQALEAAGVKAGDVEKVFATGKGKFDADFADDRLADVIAAAKAANLVVPEATMVIDAGADEIAVAVLEGQEIKEFVINQKCAAGLGLFMEAMAERLEMTIEQLGAIDGQGGQSVNDGCVVFAELDALSLLNRGAGAGEVAAAVIEACAWRASTTINDIYKPDKSNVVMMGGLVQNGAFIKALERISGIRFILPADPVYGGAIGAAALAALAI